MQSVKMKVGLKSIDVLTNLHRTDITSEGKIILKGFPAIDIEEELPYFKTEQTVDVTYQSAVVCINGKNFPFEFVNCIISTEYVSLRRMIEILVLLYKESWGASIAVATRQLLKKLNFTLNHEVIGRIRNVLSAIYANEIGERYALHKKYVVKHMLLEAIMYCKVNIDKVEGRLLESPVRLNKTGVLIFDEE